VTARTDQERQVAARAGGRCEYCRMHQALQGATFHVEHVIRRPRGGPDGLSNRAWACPSGNLHKSDRVEVIDPDSGTAVPLFNPRSSRWSDHFRWSGRHVIGITPIGRAAVAALDLNHPRRILIRQAEELFGLFPLSSEDAPGDGKGEGATNAP
jgi:hypothetical protein